MIEDSDHIEQIIEYLAINNLSPFTMHSEDGLLFISEITNISFANLESKSRKYLINKDSFEKEQNGNLKFIFSEAIFDDFGYYDNDFGWHYNTLLTDKINDRYVIRKSNILTKEFKRYFWKKDYIKEQRIKGKIFEKSVKLDKPFKTGLTRDRIVSHYVLTLLD